MVYIFHSQINTHNMVYGTSTSCNGFSLVPSFLSSSFCLLPFFFFNFFFLLRSKRFWFDDERKRRVLMAVILFFILLLSFWILIKLQAGGNSSMDRNELGITEKNQVDADVLKTYIFFPLSH